MKNKTSDKSSRRRFLSLGLLGGAGFLTKKANAAIPDPDAETIKMLTPDGKLVEVSKHVVDQSDNRLQARNEDILKWRKTTDKPKE